MTLMLIGNPNVGKTTLFNNLTGSNAQVGNWSGVTMDKLVGVISNTQNKLIDLPGTYSVAPNSEDEGVVTFALMNEEYEGILNIVDAVHLKRNLHLTIQLLETGTPVLIALNMMDELEKKGWQLDASKMAEMLSIDVVPITARKQLGMNELLEKTPNLASPAHWQLDYGTIIEKAIALLIEELPKGHGMNERWLAIQLLEGNSGIQQELEFSDEEQVKDIIWSTEASVIESKEALSLKGAIFNRRRQFIQEVYDACLSKDGAKIEIHPPVAFAKADKYLTHPIIGFAAFFGIMLLVYTLTFNLLGTPLSDLMDGAIANWIIPWMASGLEYFGLSAGNIIFDGLIDGVLTGVGGVVIFLPQIMILFFCLSVMEGTGYMARVAILMDNLFARFGLNGKAIVPLITGFGCNVPAIMATRTITSRQERLKSIAIIPFTSCSARLPVYVLLIGIFFSAYQGLIILGLYVLGMVVALLSAKLLSSSIFKKGEDHFVLEVPAYRMPQLNNIWKQTYKKGTEFLHSAGKFIVIGSIILWFLQYAGPTGLNVDGDHSFLAMIGSLLAPIFSPIGLDSWQLVSSLIVGFLAKELVASSMIIIAGSQAALGALLTPAQAASFLIFSLLYIPCLATVGVIQRETKSVKDTLWIVGYGLLVAYVISFLAYQGINFFS